MLKIRFVEMWTDSGRSEFGSFLFLGWAFASNGAALILCGVGVVMEWGQ